MVEGTGHTVFSSDRRQAVAHLCVVCTKKCCERLAPAVRILSHSAEIFLEGEADFAVIAADCHDAGQGLGYGIDCSVIRAPARYVWIKAVAHHGNGVGLSIRNRHFCNHGLSFRQLIFSAVRHQHAGCSDGGVEHLNKSLLGACVKIGQSGQPFFFDIGNITASL